MMPTITIARGTSEQESAIGNFLNVLLVRVHVANRSSLVSLVECVRESVLDVLDHEVRLDRLAAAIPRLGQQLADPATLIVPFQALPESVSEGRRFGPCMGRCLERSVSRNAGFSLPFDALISMRWIDGRYVLVCEYRRALLAPKEAEAQLIAFRDWLQGASAAPDVPLECLV